MDIGTEITHIDQINDLEDQKYGLVVEGEVEIDERVMPAEKHFIPFYSKSELKDWFVRLPQGNRFFVSPAVTDLWGVPA